MANRRKPIQHLADHALGRRVGAAQFGVLGLDGLQVLEQAVVLGIRDLGRILDVVALGVVLQLGAQLRD